jgi:hypothetical protein
MNELLMSEKISRNPKKGGGVGREREIDEHMIIFECVMSTHVRSRLTFADYEGKCDDGSDNYVHPSGNIG